MDKEIWCKKQVSIWWCALANGEVRSLQPVNGAADGESDGGKARKAERRGGVQIITAGESLSVQGKDG
jgi:hypothetical protein